MKHSIVISGWHSGTNPSSGLGIARSVKEAFPDMKIIALDYSPRSTAINDSIVDDVIILPGWADVNVEKSIEEVCETVAQNDALFISGLDVEIHEIAKHIQSRKKKSFLLPPHNTLLLTEKPAQEIADMLGLDVPQTVIHKDIETSLSVAESLGWPVIVKGSHYDAKVVCNYLELQSAIRYIEDTWGDTPIIQNYVFGCEECVAFSAFEGKLLGAVKMKKTEVTPLGKAWCGTIDPIDDSFMKKISVMVASLNWTGGGEVETIWDGTNKKRYLIDLNPRFPAWIYGSTVCGANLPGRLVSEVLSEKAQPEKPSMAGFVREVLELPTDRLEKNVFLNTRVKPQISLKGHPSGLSALSKKMEKPKHERVTATLEKDSELINALSRCIENSTQNQFPQRVYLDFRVNERLDQLKQMCEAAKEKYGVEAAVFYSLKTNPSLQVLKDILKAGCGIETISLAEYSYANRVGFQGAASILNGPGKWWGSDDLSLQEPLAIQCDSINDFSVTFQELSRRQWNNCMVGFRISPFFSNSRFGIDVTKPEVFLDLCKAVSTVGSKHNVGIQFHYAESTIGIDEWLREIEAVSVIIQSISKVTNVKFSYFDFGGGWRSKDLKTYCNAMIKAIEIIARYNQSIRNVFFEPGKLIVEESSVLISKIIGIRERGNEKDIIIGAAINDVPDALSFPHGIMWRSSKESWWMNLNSGRDRILGRICMETDILRNDISLPNGVEIGDYIAIKSVGAYDSSMKYRFGEGLEL